jgi:1,4-dihydroxy-2-naphthoate octaprenyltransferase
MATPSQWFSGARPRTLAAAVTPVAAGTGLAAFFDDANLALAALALVVAVALQVGVNYANDYSDGVRGTDAARVGPIRLTASGAASPESVRRAALFSFLIGCLAGLVIVIAAAQWWLIAIGAVSVLAAWFYTGGRSPYGYRGLGELGVFVFFGVVATVGTEYIQTERFSALGFVVATGVGALACALLVVNNLRDIPTDRAAGKRTLAVRMGDRRTRVFYVLLLVVSFLVIIISAVGWTPWAFVALLAFIPAAPPAVTVLSGAKGRELVPVLQSTGIIQLIYGLTLAIGLSLA